MKRRVTQILTFTIAIVLVGSIAYASKKKVKTKSVPQTPETSEEEALKAELLDATEDHENKLPGKSASTKRIIPVTGDENTKDQIIANQTKK